MIGNVRSEKPEDRKSQKSRQDCPEIRALVLKLGNRPGASPTGRKLDTHGEFSVVGKATVDGYTYCLVRYPTDALGYLSTTQMKVAWLAAQGLSNKEVGTRLGIAPATVAVHLSRVFRKLRIESRHELARFGFLFSTSEEEDPLQAPASLEDPLASL